MLANALWLLHGRLRHGGCDIDGVNMGGGIRGYDPSNLSMQDIICVSSATGNVTLSMVMF